MTGFRQIDESELREPHSYAPIAVLDITREELAGLGVELTEPIDDGSWSETGPIEKALVETGSGEQALLIWHKDLEGDPEGSKPLELRAPVSTATRRPSPSLFSTVSLCRVTGASG